MKSIFSHILLTIFLLIMTVTSGFAQNTKLLYSDPLDDSKTSIGVIVNNGGSFISGKGWKSTSQYSQLEITLNDVLPFEGTFIVNVTNFDPVSQNVVDEADGELKQHIINLYSQENGNKDIFDTNGSWWNIRTSAHSKYSDGPGTAGFKFLVAPRGIGTRDEEYCMLSAQWNLNQVYEFKVTWNSQTISCYVDGEEQSDMPFNGQIEPFRYVFLGRDNNGSGYCAQPGPIFSNLRIYGPGEKITFTDITSSSQTAGYSSLGYARGVSFADINADNRIDFFVSNAIRDQILPDLLYFNNNGSIFSEESAKRGTRDEGLTHSIVNADFDNDGDLDAYFANMPVNSTSPLGRNAMYQNDGSGYYTNWTVAAGLSSENNDSRGAVALDIDRDGDLDIYTANWGKQNEMYLNDGTGKMTRVNRGANGPDEDPNVFGEQGVTAADFDRDGDIDIYVCRYQYGTQNAENWLFVNDGTGNFTEKGRQFNVNVGGRSNGATFADVDNDGDLDLFVVNYAETEANLPPLYVFFNNGDGTFVDRTSQFNIKVSGYAVLFGDVDNDADLDMYLIRNNMRQTGARPELYINDGKGAFATAGATGMEVSAQDARGAALADIDNDGDLDLYIACAGGQNYLLRNSTKNSNKYIDVLCYGPGGDLGGFGAKVSVYQPGYLGNSAYLIGFQESVSSFSYLCQNQTALHFGLGSNSACDIRIVLTDGSIYEYRNVPANQRFVMDKPNKLALAYVSGDSQTGYIGTRLANPFVVQVTNTTLQRPAANVPVTFVIVQGNGTLQESQPVLTDAQGFASSYLIFGTQEGNYRVEARCNATGSPVAFQAFATRPPVQLTRIKGDNQNGVVGKTLADSLVVLTSYPNGQVVANHPVRFRVVTGGGTIGGDSAKTVYTNAQGQAAAAWSLGPKTGPQTAAAAIVESSVPFNATATADVPATLIKVSGDGQAVKPGVPFPNPFVARVEDRYGNPISNQPVYFSIISGQGHLSGTSEKSILTDQTGLAQIDWTAGPYLGPENVLRAVSYFYNSPLINSPLEWRFSGLEIDLQKSSLMATSPIAANGVSTSEIIATLRNSNNETVGAGVTVKITASGQENFLLMSDTLTDANGKVKAFLSSTRAESKQISAMILGLNSALPDSPRVVFEAVPAKIQMVAGDQQVGFVAQALSEPLTVRVTDSHGIGVGNISVQFAVTVGGGNLSGTTTQMALTNGDGQAQATLTLGVQAGSNIVEAQLQGVDGSPVLFKAQAVAGNPAILTKVSGDSQRVRPNERLFESLTVRVTDNFSNPSVNATVVFTAPNGGQVVTLQPVLSDSNGLAAAQVQVGSDGGEYYFDVQVEALSARFVAFSIPEVNHPPIIAAVRDTTIAENHELVFPITAVDPDSDAVILQVSGVPLGATFTNNRFQWTPKFDQAGEYFIGITATDSKNNISNAQTRILVTNVNRAPFIYAHVPTDTVLLAHYGDQISFKIDAYDPDSDSLNYYFKVNGLVAGLGRSFGWSADWSLPATVVISGFVSDGVDTDFQTWQLSLQLTSVEMAAFSANLTANGLIKISWETRSEVGNAGFNILRSASHNGKYEKINDQFITAGMDQHNRYEFIDQQIDAGGNYFYQLQAVATDGQISLHGPVSVSVSLPDKIVLHQNYPNPFNPTTFIVFELPELQPVTLRIFNLSGQLVSTLVNDAMAAGKHAIVWNGKDLEGRPVPSGIYYYRLDAQRFHEVKKLILAK